MDSDENDLFRTDLCSDLYYTIDHDERGRAQQGPDREPISFTKVMLLHSWTQRLPGSPPPACRDPHVYHTLCIVGRFWKLMLDRWPCNASQKL